MGKSFAIKRFFFCKWKRELVRELVISHTEWDDGPIFEFWNGYFPQYTKENLKWYERDGLLTYYDLLKYKGRSRDSEKSLNNITVINVDITDNEWKGYRMGKTKKEYKAITSKYFKSYPEKEKEKLWAVLPVPVERIFGSNETLWWGILKMWIVNFFL